MKPTVFIDGAAGTTGLELADRLVDRSDLTLVTLPHERRKDPRARAEALNDADIAVLCLPDDAAREAVALIRGDTRVIDASSAHRTAPGWIYGFPELGFDVGRASRVSNPGCYPTGFLALAAPLVRAGLVPRDWPLSANAVSGYSGGGKALIERVESDANLAWRGYGFGLDHKHLTEMQVHAGLTHAPVFSPSVARAFRGMVVEVPLPLAALPGRPSRAAILDSWRQAFDGHKLIAVHEDTPDELLLTSMAAPSDRLDLYIATDRAETQARLIATLDNLGKGAGGAAVQSLNLMAGLDPLAGLIF